MDEKKPRGKEILFAILLLVIINYATLSPSLDNGFVWDDREIVVSNASIYSLSLKNIGSIFDFSDVRQNVQARCLYIPLTHLSFALDYRSGGLDPGIFHSTNLIIHILNALLVFWLFLRISREALTSFIIALLFSIHPLHVESVAWVSERKDVLYGFFFLLSLICYHYYLQKGWLFYSLSLLAFILSLLGKPMAATLPAVLALVDYGTDRKFDRKAVLDKVPFLIPLCGALAIMVCVGNQLKEGFPAEPFTFSLFLEKTCIACYTVLYYMVRLIAPVHLSCLYQLPEKVQGALPFYFLLSPAVIAAMVACVCRARRRLGKTFLVGMGFFLITLSPVIQPFSMSPGPGFIPDRYTYIPYLGLFYIIADYYTRLYRRIPHSSQKAILVCASLVLVLVFSIASWQKCHVWKDNVTLFSDVLKKCPRSETALINRANEYNEKGEYDKALADARQILSINPRSTAAMMFVGNALRGKGDYLKALESYTGALLLAPRDPCLHYNRAIVYSLLKQDDRALEDYNAALMANPRYAEAFHNRGNIYYGRGDSRKASDDYQKALSINPAFYMAYIGLGNIAGDSGDYKKALFCYNRALSLNPACADGYLNRGIVHATVGKAEKAIEDFTCAISINGELKAAYYNRAFVFYTMGQYTRALNDVETLRAQGFIVDPGFVEKLRKAQSGR